MLQCANTCVCVYPLIGWFFDCQNEKKMALTQQETNKVKERDEQHTQELREWRADLKNRKQVKGSTSSYCSHS